MELEKDVEAFLVKLVERNGGKCLKWVCPGCAGVPDRIVLLPGGVVAFAELKRPKGGTVAARQMWWAAKLRRLGFRVETIKSKEEAASFACSLIRAEPEVKNTITDKEFFRLDFDEPEEPAADDGSMHIVFADEAKDYHVDRCICCGAPIPEGRMVCPECENDTEFSDFD